MFEYTFSDIQFQLDALPDLLRIWFGWIGLVLLVGPFFFVRHRQGRVAAISAIIFIIIQFPLLHRVGITFLLSVPHLLVWIPLLVYLSRELKYGRIQLNSVFGGWTFIAILTMIFSLVFDIRDFIRWLAGERGIINPGMQLDLPWITVPALITAYFLTGYYIFINGKKEENTPKSSS
jgi:hypothetical protein